MMRELNRPLVAVLFLALAIRVAAVFALSGKDPGPDAVDDYLPMAANVLAGQGFVNGAGESDYVRGPGYALFVAAIQWPIVRAGLPVSVVPAIQAVQALLDVLTCLLAYQLTRQILDRNAGNWAAFLYAINPLSAYACALIGPEILFAFLLTAALVALQQGLATGRYRWIAFAGLLLGLAVLSRATPILLAPVWGVWLVVVASRRSTATSEEPSGLAGRGFLTGIVSAVVLGASAASVVLPWTYRNWIEFQEFIPVAANGGVNVYAGSTDRFWPPPPEHHRQRDLRALELIAAGEVAAPPAQWSGPAEGDAYQMSLGVANYRVAWRESPGALLQYLGRKSMRLWYANQSGRQERFVGGINLVWLGLAACGIAVVIKRGRGMLLVPCLLTIAYFPVVFVGLFPLARYVVGFAPCLCVCGAFACLALQQRLRVLPHSKWELTSESAQPQMQ